MIMHAAEGSTRNGAKALAGLVPRSPCYAQLCQWLGCVTFSFAAKLRKNCSENVLLTDGVGRKRAGGIHSLLSHSAPHALVV